VTTAYSISGNLALGSPEARLDRPELAGAAPDLLHRDVLYVTTWFNRHGFDIDAEAVFADLLGEMF
jgi:hypothetical protein